MMGEKAKAAEQNLLKTSILKAFGYENQGTLLIDWPVCIAINQSP